jgi:glycosyltransferase involved in cell wall biosynthesis
MFNLAASTWNTALLSSLLKSSNIKLYVIQFYPVLKTHIINNDNAVYYYLPQIPIIDKYTSFFKRLRIKSIIKSINPDVIHGIGSEHGYVYPCVDTGHPSVVTIHGYMNRINQLSGHKSLIRKLLLVREERIALSKADSIVAINGYMKDVLKNDGIDDKKIRIIPNPVSKIYLDECSSSDRNIDIIMVGTLHELKNYHIAIRIFKKITEKYKKRPRITIAGWSTKQSEHYRRELIEYCNTNQLDNVEFTGSVNQDRLKELYCRSKVILHISNFETDSMVLSEAMACGVYPVVNPVAALEYRVQDNINGRHISIKNIDAAADLLVDILYEDTKIEYTINRELIRNERSPDLIAMQTISLYRDASGIRH